MYMANFFITVELSLFNKLKKSPIVFTPVYQEYKYFSLSNLKRKQWKNTWNSSSTRNLSALFTQNTHNLLSLSIFNDVPFQF